MTLPLPPGVTSLRADDINDEGVITGRYEGTAFVYDDGQYTELPTPPGSCCTGASAIDNEGNVAGRFSIGNFNQTSACVWRRDRGLIDLGVMNGPYSAATDIGPGGQVVGWTGSIVTISEAFLWQDSVLTLLGPVPGGVTSRAAAVSPQGIVVGSGLMQKTPGVDPSIGFLWKAGVFRLIEPLAGYDSSFASGINSVRQVTGSCVRLDSPDDPRGYLWQHGVTHGLNDLVPPGSLYIETAGAINEHGQIIARGASGHAFLLTPVGRPLGDIDIDCAVGMTDFLWVLAAWGRADSPADVNADGTVDQLDLAIVIENWGM